MQTIEIVTKNTFIKTVPVFKVSHFNVINLKSSIHESKYLTTRLKGAQIKNSQ